MDILTILPFLALFTLGAVAVFALINKRKTEERLHDDNAPRSRLAADPSEKRTDFSKTGEPSAKPAESDTGHVRNSAPKGATQSTA